MLLSHIISGNIHPCVAGSERKRLIEPSEMGNYGTSFLMPH